jgi:endonuclease/exonuclease/phosphatase family metal-dependent hydrolase
MRFFRLVVIICVFFFLACSKKTLPTSSVVKPASPQNYNVSIRVVTYNIHHANPPSAGSAIDVIAIANVIKQQNPDLVALQELDVNTTRSGSNLNQAAELGRLANMNYFFAKAINYAGGEYGVGILSKYPITSTSNTPLPTASGTNGEPRTLATANITLPDGKKIVFASTHLDAQAGDTNRVIQVNKIVELLQQEQAPVIIAGDFNAVPGTRVINALDAAFTRSCITGCGFTIPVNNPNKTIDFIAFKPSNKFKVLEHKVIDEKYASDHLPVLAVLQLQ